MSGTQCIIIILFVRVIQQYTSKRSSMLIPSSLYGNVKYFMLSKLFAAVFAMILLTVGNEWTRIDLSTVLISTASGIMLVLGSVCGLYAIRSGTMALSSLFATAGLLVPCIAGIFLYGETMSLWQWLGVLLFFLSSYLLIGAGKRANGSFNIKTVLLLIGSLLSNGIVMLLQTVFSREVENGSVTAFSFLSFILPALILLVAMGGMKLKNPTACTERISKKLLLIMLLSSLALFIVNQLSTTATALVEPAILFTLINGGNTVIAAVMAAVLFKEKFTVRSAIGILLGVVALVIVKAL